MTAVVGIATADAVYLAADSAACSEDGYLSLRRDDPKVFRVDEHMIMGVSGLPRITQLLRYGFTPPPVPKGNRFEDHLKSYLATEFIAALKHCLKEDGQKDEDLLGGSAIMIGLYHRLFVIFSDFQIEESDCGYNAIGSASDVALGALYALKNVRTGSDPELRLMGDPNRFLTIALQAAQAHNSTVRAPFVYLSTNDAKKYIIQCM